jgi:hypothetical protein
MFANSICWVIVRRAVPGEVTLPLKKVPFSNEF